MAVAFVKQATAQSGASTTTLTLTLASAPTAGNLLVMVMGGDKDTGALTLTGFTVAHQLQYAAVTLYVAWKVSDGTETSISPSWATSSVAGNMAWYGEYQDTAVSGSLWEVLGSAGAAGTAANVNTKDSGATGTLANDGFSIGAAAVDSSQSVTTVNAWGNSYVDRYQGTGGSGRGAPFVSELAVSAGTTTSTTFSYTGTADNVACSVTVFRKYAAASGPVATQTIVRRAALVRAAYY